MKLSECWQGYYQDKTILGYSPVTLKAYKIQLRLLYEFLNDPEITEVAYEDLKGYLYAQAAHLKPASLGHRVRFVRSFFRWAVDEGYTNKNPAARLQEPKTGSRIPKAMSEEDIETIREGCITPLEHAIIEFLYTTGCRIGEAVRADKRDIDWQNGSLVVLGKGSKEREVYYNTKCRIWLKKYLESRKDNDPALFVTQRAPHRMSIAEMRYIVKRVAKRAGISKNVYPHILRHSFATHLLNNGAPIEAIQTILGHEKAETTRLYANLSGERRREIYKRYF